VAKWQSSKFPGVRVRESDSRRFQGKPDRYFTIRYTDNGKTVEEPVGWLSEGVTPAFCSQIRGQIVQNIRTGEGLQSLKAQRAAEDIQKQKDIDQKAVADRENILFWELVEPYLEWSKANKKSWSVDAGAFKTHILPLLGNTPAKEIGVLSMERLKRTLLKTLAEASTAYYLSLVGSVFYKAEAWGLFNGENPLKAASKSNRKYMKISDNKRLRFLSHVEADLLLEKLEAKDPQLHDICLLSLHAGLRAGEIFNLTWQDIDIQHGVINIRDPKNNDTRQAYITPQIKTLLEVRRPTKIIKSDLIFSSRKGKRLRQVSETFGRVVDGLGLNDGVEDAQNKLVFHSLRHTFASWLCLQGTSIFTVKELMGHKRIEMTMRYSHLLPDHKKEAVLQLARTQGKTVVEIERKTN
jgi:integrase